MRRSIIKKTLSLVLSLALVVSSITVTNLETKAATLEELQTNVADANYNLALKKVTTIYPGCAEGNQVNLNNGVLGGGGAHCALSSGWGYLNESYAVIDLGDYYDASTLDAVLVQYKDAADNDTVVSRSYKIEYSADSVSYYEAVAETRVYKAPEEGQEAEGLTLDENRMTIDDVSGVEGTVRYVRVYYPTTATYGIQITEIAVFAADPQTVEVESCEDAAGVEVEVTDYNTFTYSVIAGENQEEYSYMVYLNGTKLIGDKVSAGETYEITDVDAGTYTLKVVSLYDGKVSDGIESDEFKVTDVSILFTDSKNIANVNNNPNAKIIDVSDLYIDNAEFPEQSTYTLEAAQVALNGLYPTGEAATVALRTAAGVAPVTVTIDLGEYYRATEFDKVLVAHSNPRTYVGTVAVAFSEDNETYSEVGYKTGYTCAVDNGGTADANVVELDVDKLEDYADAVRYVQLTFSGGGNGWGYVVNEIGVVMNTDTPVTGLAPKLGEINVDTSQPNKIGLSIPATVGFEDATYEALLLVGEDNLVRATELVLEDGYFVGNIIDVAKGTYTIKIRVTYSEEEKTVEKLVEEVSVENPKVSSVVATSEETNKIVVNWAVTGYYIQKYNVYMDGELVVSNYDCEEGAETYEIENVPAGIHTVSVSLVIGEEESEIIESEAVTVYPKEIVADDVTVYSYGNAIFTVWSHTLMDGEVGTYSVSLKDTDYTANVELEEDMYAHIFNDLAIGKYTVVITAVVNGVTVSYEATDVSVNMTYATSLNEFVLSVYSEEALDVDYSVGLLFGEELVEVGAEDFQYSEEDDLYKYTKKLAKGTYEVKLSDGFVLATVEIADVVAAPVINLKVTKADKNIELTWDATDAPEGQTYTVYVNRVAKVEGLTDTAYTLTDVTAGDYAITVEAVYTNTYSEETYRESAECAITIEEETTTPEPTTPSVVDPTTKEPTTVAPTTRAQRPGRATIKKVYTKKKAAKKVKLSIKKVKGAVGYAIQFSTTKKFKKVLVKRTVKNRVVTINNKKLKKAKKLYVRVKAYKLVNGKKLYSAKWSKVKKVKIK